MADKVARTHSHLSNRAKHHGEKKVVFKGTLDNPYRINWPITTTHIQDAILTLAVASLNKIADLRLSRKRKRQSEKHRTRKRRKGSVDVTINTSNEGKTSSLQTSSIENRHDGDEANSSDIAQLSQHVVVGVNLVTKRLEHQISLHKRVVLTTDDITLDCAKKNPLQIILVCRADVNPPILVEHLPHLVAAYNSLQPPVPVKIIALRSGAEHSLSQALGLRRAAVLGLDAHFPAIDSFRKALESVPAPKASWLPSVTFERQIVPTHIKQTKTSAPKDMKAEKERRKEEKARKKKI